MAKQLQQKLDFWRPKSPILAWIVVGLVLMTAILPFSFGLLAAFKLEPESRLSLLSPTVWESLKFTVAQAGLSSLIIIILAPLLGISLLYLSPRYLAISSILRTLLFCLPSVVVATGVVLSWGKQGLGTRVFGLIGIDFLPVGWLYSKYAVVVANVFMNLPFASLIIMRSLRSISVDLVTSIRLLGIPARKIFGILIWPTIRPQMHYLAGLSFLLSMGSFGAISILGGYFGATTLEMGMYQALFSQGNWGSAASFATLHAACGLIISILFLAPQYFGRNKSLSGSSPSAQANSLPDVLPRFRTAVFAASSISILFDLLVATPLLATSIDALGDIRRITDPDSELAHIVWRAIKQSMVYAVPSALLSTLLAWNLTKAVAFYNFLRNRRNSTSILLSIFSINIVPGMASAFGLMALSSWLPELSGSIWPVVLLHTSLALPFIFLFSHQTYTRDIHSYFGLMHLTGVSSRRWILDVEWPMMRKSLALMFVIALSLSFNETSIVTMLGDIESPALTTTMISLMGHYKFADSAVVSSCLIITTAVALITYSQVGKSSHGNH